MKYCESFHGYIVALYLVENNKALLEGCSTVSCRYNWCFWYLL